MKRFTLALVAAVALLGLPGRAHAQGASPVQQIPAHLDAAAQIATSASTGATLTLTPNGGEIVYVYELDITNCAGASAVSAAATTAVTTTNLTGAPQFLIGSGTTAGACAQTFSVEYPTGLKAQAPGTAVTFVLPAFATNQTIRLNVAWRSAPVQ